VIAVGLADGAEAGVELVVHRPAIDDANIVGQHAVEGPLPPIGLHEAGGVEVTHLTGGVHPGIGTAGPGHLDGLLAQLGDDAHQLALDAADVGLNLPACVVGAPIGDGQTDAHAANATASRRS